MTPYSLAQFSADVVRSENASGVVAICQQIQRDAALLQWSAKIAARVEAGEPYWDLACALRQIAEGLQPRNYLEIGVRLGKSSAMVVASAPAVDISAFDLWISPYAGLDNPGPDFVRRQLSGVGHRGQLDFFDGDSRVTIPAFLAAHPQAQFDLVHVDGDHSDEGAWIDLVNVADIVAPGGYLLFDDLTHPFHTLLPIWRRFQEEYQERFEFVENLADHYGTGVARRRD
jgi:predicted O-methyltransferase YrrM